MPPVDELIPHAGESVLLERVIAHDGESTTALVRVGKRGWLRSGAPSLPSWLAVEYMAQCVAAHEGILARIDGRTLPVGFLVSVRKLVLHRSRFALGESLRVSARRVRGRPGLGVLSHRCEIHLGEAGGDTAPVAFGRLSIAVERARA